MNSSLDNVYELLRLGYGDAYRLGDIKKRLESGTILYASDNNYLEKLVYQYSKEIQKVITHKKTKPTRIPEPKREPKREPIPEPIPEPKREPIPEPYEQYQPEPTPEPTAVDESEVLVSKKDPNERRNATLGGLFFLFGGLAFMFIIPWGGDGGTVYHSHQICNVFPGAGPDACDTIGWSMIGGTISVILGLLCLIGFVANPQKR
jgi:hypothetical protein